MISYSVLNTIAATGGDISLSAGNLTITGAPSAIRYLGISSANGGLLMPLVEKVQVTTVSYSAANSTTYTFSISQLVNGVVNTQPITYTSLASGDTTTTITTALKTMINKLNLGAFQIVATGTTTLTLTANAGFPIFKTVNISNCTVTEAMAGVSIASNTTATPTVCTTSTPHGLVTGNVITITSADEAKLVSGTYRVVYASTTTFTLYNMTTNAALGGTSTTTATVVILPEVARGTGASLVAAGLTGAVATSQYASLTLSYGNRITDLLTQSRSNGGSEWSFTLYISANLTASPYTATTNFADLATAIGEKLHDYVASTTNADPAGIAIIA